MHRGKRATTCRKAGGALDKRKQKHADGAGNRRKGHDTKCKGAVQS